MAVGASSSVVVLPPSALPPQDAQSRGAATNVRTSFANVNVVQHATRERAEWPPEKTAELKRLFDERLPFSQIADRMGISKGAVGAKVDRMRRVDPTWTRPPTPVVRAPQPDKPRPPRAKPQRPALEPVGRALDLLDLNNTTCRFPALRRDGSWLFCGEPVEEGSGPYCRYHAGRCFLPKGSR